MGILIVLIATFFILLYFFGRTKAPASTQMDRASVVSPPSAFTPTNEEEELAFLEANKENRAAVRLWFDNKKSSGYYFSSKGYAMAMSIMDGKKWLSDDEYDAKIQRQLQREAAARDKEVLITSVSKKLIDILLDYDLEDTDQQELIESLFKPHARKRKLCGGIKKHAYWHAMHIIMNSNKIPDKIAYQARNERQKVMGNFTRRKISEFPLGEVKQFTRMARVKLTTADVAEYQNIANFDLDDFE